MRKLLLTMLALSPALADAQWTYSTRRDEMRGQTMRMAFLNSDNLVQLDSPYRGGSRLKLGIQKQGRTDVYVEIDKGQIPCFTSCTVAVKFDNEKVVNWKGAGVESGQTNVIGFVPSSSFLPRLKASKQLIVEVEIFDHGREQFTFRTAGLKWD